MPRANMNVILLERIESLGNMGEVVKVRPGFARNYLLPQKKALRASDDNLAYYEAQKDQLEKANADRRSAAEKEAKKLEGKKITLIRLASEGGQMYGSVNARDISEAVNDQTDIKIGRGQVVLNQALKTIGLFKVPVALHPEVKVDVTINIARTEDEAKIQEETGKALIADEDESLEEAKEEVKEEIAEDAKADDAEEASEEDAANNDKDKEKAKDQDAA